MELHKMQMSKLVCFLFSLHYLFLSHMPALPSRHVALLFHVTYSVTCSLIAAYLCHEAAAFVTGIEMIAA